MAEYKPFGWVDLAVLFAVDGGVRGRFIANLRESFAAADATADDYVLVGPGEGE